jgi:hypothetical protein
MHTSVDSSDRLSSLSAVGRVEERRPGLHTFFSHAFFLFLSFLPFFSYTARTRLRPRPRPSPSPKPRRRPSLLLLRL